MIGRSNCLRPDPRAEPNKAHKTPIGTLALKGEELLTFFLLKNEVKFFKEKFKWTKLGFR